MAPANASIQIGNITFISLTDLTYDKIKDIGISGLKYINTSLSQKAATNTTIKKET
ncbi:hypothetical protein GCM10022258_39420 [Aquimarina gracilis]